MITKAGVTDPSAGQAAGLELNIDCGARYQRLKCYRGRRARAVVGHDERGMSGDVTRRHRHHRQDCRVRRRGRLASFDTEPKADSMGQRSEVAAVQPAQIQ